MIRNLASLSALRTSPIRASSPIQRSALRFAAFSFRSVATERITPDQEQTILVNQRKQRPMSPHLTIYQPQLTWYLSSLHRITGVFLATSACASLAAYGVLPALGFPISVSELVSYWGAAPEYLKLITKSAFAYPFVFHTFNGVRHLVWDTGRNLTIKGVYRSGYLVSVASLVLATGLAFFL